MTIPDIDWIAADWGTTRLRIWAMDENGRAAATAESGDGMGQLSKDQFESALLSLAGDWLSDDRITPVIACGMVGARQGWIEAPYRSTPAAMPSQKPLTLAPTTDPRIAVHIIAGLMQSEPPDVMRGEETQIAGFLSTRPGFEGVICMPGTHTKWTWVSAETVTSFSSHMTGELFDLLRTRSVLRHSLSDQAVDPDAFADAVGNASGSLTSLFSIRADDLLNGVSPAISLARLSAALIASEVDAMSDDLDGRTVILLGRSALVRCYSLALETRGIEAEIVDGSAMTLNGLIAAKTARDSA